MSSGINAPCSIAGGSTGYLQPIAPCKASPSWSTTIRLSTGLRATLLSIGWNTVRMRWHAGRYEDTRGGADKYAEIERVKTEGKIYQTCFFVSRIASGDLSLA